MTCPKCGKVNTKTYSTYRRVDGFTVIRLRICETKGCRLQFRTEERPLPSAHYILPLTRRRKRNP